MSSLNKHSPRLVLNHPIILQKHCLSGDYPILGTFKVIDVPILGVLSRSVFCDHSSICEINPQLKKSEKLNPH